MKKGFTLIELIVVIAIIAILAAIIAPNAFKAIEKAKIARVISDMKATKSAAQTFYVDTGTIPCQKVGGWAKDPGFVQPITAINCDPVWGSCDPECIDVSGWDGPYLERWPQRIWSKPRAGFRPGDYNWNVNTPSSPHFPVYLSCSRIGIVTLEVYGAVSVSNLERIDEILDDGDLTTGYFYRIGPEDDPNYVNFIATYQ